MASLSGNVFVGLLITKIIVPTCVQDHTLKLAYATGLEVIYNIYIILYINIWRLETGCIIYMGR